ncbi:FAD-dependent oxidoreductase [uncultured Jatrophihabitans sp.]|uniref:FAD-dependent oxidoreductase n=1 Tax=uncultured Jatrophihabitans sp. TaxID=1610747 RepID=UPI0035CC764F
MTEFHDVVVVGAGLAGLICARDLHRAGLDVVVLEDGDEVGGRIRTDRVDGLLLDRGFQLLNPGYPRAPADLDLVALDLHPFEAGAVVARGDTRRVLADPRRSPRDSWATATTTLGTLGQRLRLAAWVAEIGFGPAQRIKHRPDLPFIDELRRRGIDGELVDSVLRPFLSGTLADGELATSRRLAELIMRSFVKGTPGVPASGMQAIPEQVAAALPDGAVRCGQAVTSVRDGAVTTSDGTVTARAVVVAAGPVASAGLLGQDFGRTRALTTYYHLAQMSPAERTMLHLDGDRRGPVVNSAVMTDAAPTYAPGRALIASSVLGADGTAETERAVRRQLTHVYGVGTDAWEHVHTYVIRDALPDTPPGTPLQRPVRVAPGLFVSGDFRDTASIQGALVSGHRAAAAVRRDLGR